MRQIADGLSILIACMLSNLYFLSNLQIIEIITPTISLFILLTVVFIPIFYLFGVYTFLRSTDQKNKADETFACKILKKRMEDVITQT